MRGGGVRAPPAQPGRLSRTLPPAAACHRLSQPGPAGPGTPVKAGEPWHTVPLRDTDRLSLHPAARAGPASPG